MTPVISFFGRLSLAQRVLLLALPAGFAVALVGLILVASAPTYQTLAAGLTPATAATVTTALDKAGITYTLAPSGAAVMVTDKDLGRARIALGAAGVSTTGGTDTKGFELFDTTSFGASAFDQKVNYQRAQEGELTRTIEAMAGVKSARVAIVPAGQGLFATQDKPASASVVLEMVGGVSPAADLVRAVRASVSASVAGLASDAVTVVDANGKVLAGPGNEVTVGMAQAQGGLEATLQAKVQTLVDAAVGPGHATVAVSVVLDQETLTRESTTYQPVNTANYTPVSVRQILEQYGLNGQAPVAAGVPGTTSNVPGLPTYPQASAIPAGASPAPSGGYSKNDVTVNYNLSQVIERIARDPGTVIKQMGVAVMIDQNVAGSMDLAALRNSIAAAVSADAVRGDQIAVQAIPFAATTNTPAPLVDESYARWIGPAIAVIVALLLLLLVWRNLRALRRRAEEVLLLSLPSPLMDTLALLPMVGDTGSGQGNAEPVALTVEELQMSSSTQLVTQLRKMADQQPEDLIALFTMWLREENRS